MAHGTAHLLGVRDSIVGMVGKARPSLFCDGGIYRDQSHHGPRSVDLHGLYVARILLEVVLALASLLQDISGTKPSEALILLPGGHVVAGREQLLVGIANIREIRDTSKNGFFLMNELSQVAHECGFLLGEHHEANECGLAIGGG